jgi:phospholipase/lecithinase/hemolysin
MTIQFLRRIALLAAWSASALMAGCGSGTIESQLQPSRFIAFGDGFSDVGQTGAKYTVNDGSTNIWVQEVAGLYGLGISPAAAGGNGYAQGNARITQKPDAAQNALTPTIKEQIDAFLARDRIGANDVVIMNGGISDTIVQWAATLSGRQTQAQMNANLQQAGTDLATQVRRLVQAGATHVVLTGSYNVGRTPWGTGTGGGTILNDAMVTFNTALLLAIVDLGANVLYIDGAYYYNLVTGVPSAYSLTDSTSIMCTSKDPGNGIGVGLNQINSALCTPATIVNGLNYNLYFFADSIYPTPAAQRLFGDYVFGRLRTRW